VRLNYDTEIHWILLLLITTTITIIIDRLPSHHHEKKVIYTYKLRNYVTDVLWMTLKRDYTIRAPTISRRWSIYCTIASASLSESIYSTKRLQFWTKVKMEVQVGPRSCPSTRDLLPVTLERRVPLALMTAQHSLTVGCRSKSLQQHWEDRTQRAHRPHTLLQRVTIVDRHRISTSSVASSVRRDRRTAYVHSSVQRIA